jgi:hypothetical protein
MAEEQQPQALILGNEDVLVEDGISETDSINQSLHWI